MIGARFGIWATWAAGGIGALGADLADALLGRACLGCGGAPPRGRAVCPACDARVPRSGAVLCLRCMQEGETDGADSARSAESRLPGAAAAGCPRHGSERLLLAGPPYESPLDRIVHSFKYAGARGALPWIADLLPEPPGRETQVWREYVLVPVPLHPARRAWRGFDQARLLAESAAARWGIPAAEAIARRRDHAPQARLDAAARRENVNGAFALTGDGARLLRSRPVLLVDDVATTGSTLLEAAAAVSAASPSWILSLAACHGGLPARPSRPETASSARVATPRSL
jgi:ComF family protein